VTALTQLTDEEIEREVARLERALDRLDDATWPAANLQRRQIVERIAELTSGTTGRRT
jgi:hypothetical protein